MPRVLPTRAQQRILELLSASTYLTTRQIDEYLGLTTTKRATERKLQRLAEHGFIQARMLRPELGAASERYWVLLDKGRDSIERSGVVTTLPNITAATAVTLTRVPREHSRVVSEERSLPAEQVTLLQLLAKTKHLTTKQIRQHLHADKPEWYTWKMLYLLRRTGYIFGARLNPERGAASECYWGISRHGARIIGVEYGANYRRRPARQTIEHRGLLLEMSRQVAAAGWSLISPASQGSGQGQPEETPQRRQLVEATLKKEGLAIEKLLLQGYPANRLAERIDRWNAKQVGALVPRKVGEHVAYVPGQPERTVLLIPHPTMAGRAFWTRSPGVRAESGGRRSKTGSRLNRYARLAQVLPVLAVFGSEETGRQYAGLLKASGFDWTLVQDIGEKLLAIGET